MNEFMFQLVGLAVIYGGIMLYGHLRPVKTSENENKACKKVKDLFYSDTSGSDAKNTFAKNDVIKLNALYAVFQARIKAETGIDEPEIRERIVKNTGKIEQIYRTKNRIPEEQRLYAPEYIGDDFFNFYLGYILDDKLFDKNEWLIEKENTATCQPKTNYGAIAKQRTEGNDPYGVIWERMKNDIGISNDRFKRRLARNTSKLESMYRKQRIIPEDRELFNRRGYVDDDFFAFILGYILADHLFDGDDKLVAEAASHNSSDAEVETEYEEVNSWEYETANEYEEVDSWDDNPSGGFDYNSNDYDSPDYDSDELDLDELEYMEPWERRQALEEAGLDPDNYDFDFDLGSGSRDVTFQDDYGFNGDDMYCFDGEFVD